MIFSNYRVPRLGGMRLSVRLAQARTITCLYLKAANRA